MSPTLHCTVILHWLNILHPKLRDLVTQRFCTELRNASYAAIWPEISRSVDMFLKELSEDASVCRYDPQSRSRGSYSRPPNTQSRSNPSKYTYPPRSTQSSGRSCDYCRVLGRMTYNTHNIDDCLFLKKERPRGYSKAISTEEYDAHQEEFYEEYPSEMNRVTTEHCINKISVRASPMITVYSKNKAYDVTLDCGGTCSVMDDRTADDLNCVIRPTDQTAYMADGRTKLDVVGETDIEFSRLGQPFRLNALVCRIAEPSIIGGMPFLEDNNITICYSYNLN